MRRVAVVASVLVVVAAAAAAFLVVTRIGTGGATSARHARAATSAAPDQAAKDAGAAAAALGRLGADPQSLVATQAAGHVGMQARTAVPAGTKVAPDATSWAPDGVGGGTMSVTLRPPGRPSTSYAAVMVKEGGAWKVLATLPLPDAAGPGPSAAISAPPAPSAP